MISTRRITRADIRAYYTHTSFDYWAAWLDRHNLSMHFGYHENSAISHSASLTKSIEVLADAAKVIPGDRVLDAGCGIGGSSLWLARERGARVVGIALGADQIRTAQREARWSSRSTRPRFLVADFTGLPFPAESFDVVWAQESLCHAEDKAKFFNEAARVLVPKGRIVISDFMLRRLPIEPESEVLLEEWFNGWAMSGLWTAAQHVSAARAAEFCDMSVQDITRYTLPSHRRLYGRARWALPVAIVLRALGLRTAVQDGNVRASLRQYQTLRRDWWFYAMMTARKQ